MGLHFPHTPHHTHAHTHTHTHTHTHLYISIYSIYTITITRSHTRTHNTHTHTHAHALTHTHTHTHTYTQRSRISTLNTQNRTALETKTPRDGKLNSLLHNLAPALIRHCCCRHPRYVCSHLLWVLVFVCVRVCVCVCLCRCVCMCMCVWFCMCNLSPWFGTLSPHNDTLNLCFLLFLSLRLPTHPHTPFQVLFVGFLVCFLLVAY
jgi:hypothetical protein